MGFFQRLGEKHYSKEGKGEDYPTHGVALYFAIIGTHFWKFISLNLIFVLFCLPVVTIPAALAGMNRVLLLLIRKGHCFFWADFWEEFKKSFWRSLLKGVITIIGLALAYYLLNIGLTNGQSIYGIVFSALGIVLAVFFAITAAWYFVLVPMLDLPTSALLKNARLLSILEWKQSLSILTISVVMIFLIMLFFPISVPIYLLLLIAFVQYTICFILNSSIQKRVITPFEQQQKENELS